MKGLQGHLEEVKTQNDDILSILLVDQLESTQKRLKVLENDLKSMENQLLSQKEVNLTDFCRDLDNCAECSKAKECGWCSGIEKKCVKGDEVGPIEETCSLYSYDRCNENDCTQISDCEVVP